MTMWVVVVKFIFLVLLAGISRSRGTTCAPRWFDCGNGKCISEIWLCDGENDCGNFKDEKDCEYTRNEKNCLSSQFQCITTHVCIPEKWQCDGEKDCDDGSDERECNVSDHCTGFVCSDHHCIPETWRCDGKADCIDGSDEKLCPEGKLCNDSEFLCPSGSCILQSLVCNGKKDCVDGSDEGPHCGDPCENETCSQNCKSTPTGPHCYCNDGYTLDAKDNETCRDIDECQQEGFCSHECTNTAGSYKCSCHEGYELFNRTCRARGADPLLIYSTGKEVRGIHLRENQFFHIVGALSRVSAVDVDPGSERVYLIEVSNKSAIYSTKLDGSDFRNILSHGLLVPEDIAVDYITNNLYITDSGLRQVLACKSDGMMCHVLHANVEKPRSIALDLDNGLMYWSDWGEHSFGIYRSGMDGSRRISIVSNRIGWPNGIALDHTTNRLYWADAKMRTIEFITLDGSQRTVLLNTTVFHPYSLAVFEDTLYWSDWSTFSLESCNKFTGHKVTILERRRDRIMGVHVYHPVLTSKVSNPCWSNDCSHMCLMSPAKGFRCACPHSFTLSTDEKTCIKDPGESVFVNEGSSVFYISPKMVGSEAITEIPLSLGEAMISRVAYDSKLRYIFVADLKKPAIYAINMTSLHMQTLVANYMTLPEDLSFDWKSNNLYWIDSAKGTAEVINTNLLKRAVIVRDLRNPVALAISPAQGLMFIATIGSPDVSMYDMDGKNRRVLYSVPGFPMSLALHPSKSILYWADSMTETISYVNYSSNGEAQIMKTKLTGVMSVSASEEYIYWTGKKRELNLIKGNVTSVLQLPGQENRAVSRKVTYSPGVTTAGLSMCLIGNGGCSYVCLTSPAGRTCACPSEMVLSPDNVTCVARECDDDDFRCADGQCLSTEKRCDGTKDCADGSDEVGCMCEFFCSETSQCLPWSKVCDGNKDCQDMSDEGGLCSTSCAADKDNCSHTCQKTPEGSKCFCNKGYRLLPDNKTCEDINECHEVGICSHFCSNRKGNYKCSCAEGYRLKDDNHSCMAEEGSPTLMYLLEDVIRGLDLNTLTSKFHFIVKGANMRGLDYDIDEDVFYWTELNDESINSYYINTNKHDVIYRSCSRPVAVRYDWLAGNLYFLDEKSNIGVCTKNGNICKNLIKSGAQRIDSLAISPPYGYMFWTIWANTFRYNRSGIIRRAEMDGSHDLIILSSKILSPTAITVDHVLKRIYWADIKLRTLESADFHGFKRRQIVQSGVYHPVASVVFEDYLYWVDWGVDSIMRCHTFIEGRCENVTIGNVKAHDILVAHKVMQSKRNSTCLDGNGGCSHVCLTTVNRRTCACSSAMTLDVDGRTCVVKKCEENEFRCEDGLCIPVDLRCDGSKQCNDGSDELNCGSCEELGMQKCKDGTCVNNYQICDGKKDCSSNEDEMNCNPVIQPRIE